MAARTRSRSAWVLAALTLVATLTACTGDDGATSATTLPPPPPETTTTTEPPLEAGEEIFVYSPNVGDCFDRRRLERPREETATGQTDIVLLLDCALPHKNEVFAVVDVPDPDGPFPGEDPMLTHARRECVRSFEAYVGRAYEVSTLEIGYYLPSQLEWDEGVRTIGCYVFDLAGGKLVGSVAGSGR